MRGDQREKGYETCSGEHNVIESGWLYRQVVFFHY